MRAIRGFVANAALRVRGRSLLFIVLNISLFLALPPSPATAMTEDQAIDIAVQAVARGGSAIGLNIPPEAAIVLKELVKCGINGGSVADCAKQSVVYVAL